MPDLVQHIATPVVPLAPTPRKREPRYERETRASARTKQRRPNRKPVTNAERQAGAANDALLDVRA